MRFLILRDVCVSVYNRMHIYPPFATHSGSIITFNGYKFIAACMHGKMAVGGRDSLFVAK